MTQKEAIHEIHDRVRQCFSRHQFKTFGDALSWWQNEGYEIKTLEAGEQGESKFSTDILWLVSQFGPKSKVQHDVMDVRKVPKLKPVKVLIRRWRRSHNPFQARIQKTEKSPTIILIFSVDTHEKYV